MKILFVENNDITLLSFRKELLDRLIEEKHDICLVGEFSNEVIKEYSKRIHVRYLKTDLKSKNIFKNLSLIRQYKKLIREYKPDVLLTFTIKPNIYCNLSKKKNYVSITNITGLGSSFDKSGPLKRYVLHLYRKTFKNVDHVMFQNEGGLNCFKKYKININNYSIIPGSGVNDKKFDLLPLDKHTGTTFLYPSRFIKSKGFNVLVDAIPQVIKEFPDTKFIFLGSKTKESSKLIKNKELDKLPNIEFCSFGKDIISYYKKCDFVISPSFYNEGISNVLLESLASGRPIITTNDNFGCKELLIEGRTGYGVRSNNINDLISAIKKAILTDKNEITSMGKFGREFVIKNFNRNTTIEIYLKILEKTANI